VPSTEQMYKIFEEVFEGMNFTDDFTCSVSLIAEKPQTPKAVYQYKLYRRDSSDQTTLVLLAPEVDKGQGYLQEKNNLWFYDPISHQFTHSSIKKNLNDTDAKVSDVKKKRKFKDTHEITKIEEAKVGKMEVYAVTAKILSKDESYAEEKYFIKKTEPLILKIESYGASGRLMRTTLIPKYVKLGKANLPVHQIYINEINKGDKTTQIFSDFDTSKIPDVVFTKAY
ncbi:outer membrane lipoprotein-sorting protein, partial [Treponema pedis]|uniref:outer membrane lipoprotein-sorting protein n=1 Tax=Treponema pedis TaxID=409322 RepID=UPI000466C09B